MPRAKSGPRKNINFRQSSSDRSATGSYRNFAKSIKEKFIKRYDKN